MALKIGNNAVANAFVGSSQVRRAYKGGTLVYQGFSPASEQEFIQQEAAGGPAKLLKVYGKSVANNQMAGAGRTSNGVTAALTNGVYELTGTISTTYSACIGPSSRTLIAGRKYLLQRRLVANPNNLSFYVKLLNQSTASSWDNVIVTAADAGGTLGISNATNGTDFTGVKIEVSLIDLTLRFGAGNEPTSVDEALRLLGGDAFDPTYDPGSLQSNKTAELRAERIPVINVWDEEWTRGYINSDGTEASAGDYYKPTSLIPIQPSTQYWFKKPARIAQRQAYYDASGSFLSLVDLYNTSGTGGQFTTPSNAFYMKFYIAQYPYQNDICINLSDPAINGQYFPHWRGKLTLNLSTLTGKLNGEGASVVVYPDGLRGVGDIRDEAYGSTGVVRLGKRAYQAGDESDTSVLTDGTNTIYPLATPLTYTLDTPLPTDLTCEQGDILQRVSDNNCPFVGEMRFGL